MNPRRIPPRIRLADTLTRNGGYNNSEVDAALSWDVSLSYGGEHGIVHELWKCGEFFKSEAAMRLQYPQIEREVRRMLNEAVHSQAVEDMRSMLSDTDCYRMWCPETATRHGFAPGALGAMVVGTDKPFSVKFELHGRSGKHLCVTEFEGYTTDAALIEVLRQPDYIHDSIPGNLWCRQLLAMTEDWDQCFSRATVQRQYVHSLAWQIGRELEDEWDRSFEPATSEAG